MFCICTLRLPLSLNPTIICRVKPLIVDAGLVDAVKT